ncbi:MAG: acetyl-CoA carboxylase carboxyltransferase subunit alpha [Spirochaetes bacterium]|nr:acetyl-CoA carboxylase carboxyltransferase subunit alpha [Spirochaetota bacterium]MCK5268708.1 acetyl-CoA carboxylase carboxyltransferase subunit alpha [Spirochaetota bacterium]
MEVKGLDFEAPIIELENKIKELEDFSSKDGVDFAAEIAKLESKVHLLKKDIYAKLSSWQKVQVARHPQRPYFTDYVDLIFENFTELHGDRQFADDKSIIAGIAKLNGEDVVLIGQQKGRETKENIERNFGMPRPEGYRKALRFMKFAEKFKKTIITFIDTPGAYPGLEAEERGQGEAIARNLRDMSSLKVPIIVVIVGEGGSGGALGIGIGNRILMMENSIYSVISPEGCASILWRDATKAEDAAEAMKITAPYLKKFNVIDEIVPEPVGGAHRDHVTTAKNLKKVLLQHLLEIKKLSPSKLVEKRHEKFRKMGPVMEA